MTIALVPLKPFGQAKTRLAESLTPMQRQTLVRAMAQDMLSVLQGCDNIDEVLVVGDAKQADQLGIGCIAEAELGVKGLNAVLQAALERLCFERGVIVIHADLPLLQAADVGALLSPMQSGKQAIACDRSGSGTNALALLKKPPALSFGRGSYEQHRATLSRHTAVQSVRRQGLALDVDTPQDLRHLQWALTQAAAEVAPHTRNGMAQLGLDSMELTV